MYPQFESDKRLVKCHPSSVQLRLEQMEFYAFAHFNTNTFTNTELGDGREPTEMFNPTDFRPAQWVEAMRSAGIKGLILTCKHHEGFCLWPSRYTEYCVRHSPWRDGRGDAVREVVEACRGVGMAFGIYLSPWDKNSEFYGTGKPYDDFFCRQLTELCTGYGELFCVWFDGACGEGPNGKTQIYDWRRYYTLIRKLQPNAAISIMGPDIRWCGNEAGNTRESEWSVLPNGYDTPDEVASKSFAADDGHTERKKFVPEARDLGSRNYLEGAPGCKWSPAETDTSIRLGWFYHAAEDDKVRSTETLIDIWYRTVGGNSTLLLNIPPDKRGLLPDTDVSRLREMGEYLKRTFECNFAEDAEISADKDDGYHTAENLRVNSYDAYYKPFDGENSVEITVNLRKALEVTHIVLKEHLPMGQRIEKYIVEAAHHDGSYFEIGRGTTVGYQKIQRFEAVSTDRIRIRVTDSRVCPVLSFIGIY